MTPDEIKRLINWEAELILPGCTGCEAGVEAGDVITPLFKANSEGRFLEVLDAVPSFFGSGMSRQEVAMCVKAYLSEEVSSLEKHSRQLQCIAIGGAFVLAWLQENTTGPMNKAHKQWCEDKVPEFDLKDLSIDGEPAHAHVSCPLMLSCAAAILLDNKEGLSRTLTAGWWAGRAAKSYQWVFAEPVPTLKTFAEEGYKLAGQRIEESGFEDNKKLRAVHCLETGHVALFYNDEKEAEKLFEKAQAYTGLHLNLTGVLGVRTKFQTFKTVQLVLDAKSEPAAGETPAVKTEGEGNQKDGEGAATVPRLVPLEDDTLLKSGPKLDREDAMTEGNLDVIDQCTILAKCAYYVNVFSSEDYEACEKLEAMVRRVEKNPNNWMVHSTSLREKCRVEYKRHKTKERAVLQYQVLVDQFFDEEPAAPERLMYVFAVAYAPRFSMRTKLAELMVHLGIAASALIIYEDLKDWDGMITCYQIMDKKEKAEEIVRELLSDEKTETPNLWCSLGDLTRDDRCYETAWQMSKCRNSRAMRSLSYSAFRRKDFEECVACADKALAINPLYPRMWFTMSCAAMRLEQWDKAARGFVRVVTQDAEDAESWSNLATIYIRQNRKAEAYGALKEALKAQQENWKMWENFLVVCIDLTHYREACMAYQRLNDLVKNGYIDYQILSILGRVVINLGDEALTKAVLEVFGRVTSIKSNDEVVWKIYAEVHEGLGNKEKAKECITKRYRALQKPGWQNTDADMKAVCDGAMELFELYKEEGTEPAMHSAKLMVNGLVKRIEKLYVVDPVPEECQRVLDAAAALV